MAKDLLSLTMQKKLSLVLPQFTSNLVQVAHLFSFQNSFFLLLEEREAKIWQNIYHFSFGTKVIAEFSRLFD